MTSYYSEFSKAYVAVDCIIFGFEQNKLRILLGRRNLNPGRGEWTLNGVFVQADESLDMAADRALRELTGLSNLYMMQIAAFGDVTRDPGERVVSVAYCALINVKDYDKRLLLRHNLQWVDIEEMPKLYSDHNLMVEKAIALLRQHLPTQPLCFQLLPDLFTLTQLQSVYEAILGEPIDKRNFRKRIKSIDFIEKTNLIDKKTSKRGAALYKFNKRAYEKYPSFKF